MHQSHLHLFMDIHDVWLLSAVGDLPILLEVSRRRIVGVATTEGSVPALDRSADKHFGKRQGDLLKLIASLTADGCGQIIS